MERRSGCGRPATPATSPRSAAASASRHAHGASATESSAYTACHGAHIRTLHLYRCHRRSEHEALYEHRPTANFTATVAPTRATTVIAATTAAGTDCHSPGVRLRPRQHPLPTAVLRLTGRCRPACRRTMQTQRSSETTCPSFSPTHHKHQPQPTQHIVPGSSWTSAAYPGYPAAQRAAHTWTLSARP